MERALYSGSGSDGIWATVLEKAWATKLNDASWFPELIPQEIFDRFGLMDLLPRSPFSGAEMDRTRTLLHTPEQIHTLVASGLKTQRHLTMEIGVPLPNVTSNKVEGLTTRHAYGVVGSNATHVILRDPNGNAQADPTRQLAHNPNEHHAPNLGIFQLTWEEATALMDTVEVELTKDPPKRTEQP